MTTQILSAPDTTKLDALLAEVRAERLAQITREGYTAEHDDAHTNGELAEAAAAYAYAGPIIILDAAGEGEIKNQVQAALLWPWATEHWKPSHYRKNLIRAQALLAGELERVERLADRVKFFWVGEDTEIYAAEDRESLIRYLREDEGTLPEDPDEIQEVSGDCMGGLNEDGTVRATLREIIIDHYAAGTFEVVLPVQIQTSYN